MEINIEFKNHKSITPREEEVLDLVMKGKSNNEIANLLDISAHTAKAHVCSLMHKYDVNSRILLAVNAVAEKLSK